MGGGVSGAFRGALARLKSAPLWVWITILLTFGLLVFAYLQWRKSSSSSSGAAGTSSAALGTVPSNGSGQPLWNTADTSGMVTGNMTDLAALLAYLQSQQTPNSPGTANPNNNNNNNNNNNTTGTPQYFTITENYTPANASRTTLSGIAGMYHTSVSRLLQLNPQITNPNLVYKGEKIRVA